MANYIYHPSHAVLLGYPIDSRNLSNSLINNGFFEFDNDLIDDNFGCSIEFDFKIAKSHSSLYKLLHMDANAEIKFTLSSLKSTLSWQQEFSFDDKTIVFVFTGKKIYNREIKLGRLKFSKYGLDVWKKTKKPSGVFEFQRYAGTEIVTEVRRGNIISLVYIFKTSSASSKISILNTLNAGWSSGTVSLNLNQVLKSVDESFELNVQGFQSGISASKIDQVHKNLTDIINLSPGDIPGIKKILEETLKNVSIDDKAASPIVDFKTLEISNLPELNPYSNLFRFAMKLNPLIDLACQNLFKDLLDAFFQVSFLNSLLKMYNPYDFKEKANEIISSSLRDYLNYQNEILSEFIKINDANNENECIPQEITPVKPLLVSNIINGQLMRPLPWDSEAKIWNRRPNTGNFQTIMWPNVIIRFDKFLREFSILKKIDGEFKEIAKKDRDQIDLIVRNKGSLKNVWSFWLQDENIIIPNWDSLLVDQKSAEIRAKHILSTINEEYKLQFTLVDGSSDVINIGNPAKQSDDLIFSFKHLSEDQKEFLTTSINSMKLYEKEIHG